MSDAVIRHALVINRRSELILLLLSKTLWFDLWSEAAPGIVLDIIEHFQGTTTLTGSTYTFLLKCNKLKEFFRNEPRILDLRAVCESQHERSLQIICHFQEWIQIQIFSCILRARPRLLKRTISHCASEVSSSIADVLTRQVRLHISQMMGFVQTKIDILATLAKPSIVKKHVRSLGAIVDPSEFSLTYSQVSAI